MLNGLLRNKGTRSHGVGIPATVGAKPSATHTCDRAGVRALLRQEQRFALMISMLILIYMSAPKGPNKLTLVGRS